MMGIEFGIPYAGIWLGVALFLTVFLYILMRAFERMRKGRLERFVEAKLAPRLLAGLDASARKPLIWFTMIGFIGLALALAQPHWGQSLREIRKHSRDFVILLDTSESMRAENPLPNRLESAKQKVAALADKAPADRFALIAFSGAAQLHCPLTLDHGYFRTVLGSIDTDAISLEGTNLAAAFEEAIELFQKEDAALGVNARSSRGLLLISDGEDLEGGAVEAAERAAEFARIFVLGMGDPNGAEVAMPASMSKYLSKQPPHLSKLDESTLKDIALAGNGAYARAGADLWDVEQLLERFNVLSARDMSSELRLRKVNRYQWPLAIAVAAFAAEGAWLVLMPWLRRWRMRKKRAAGVEGAEYA